MSDNKAYALVENCTDKINKLEPFVRLIGENDLNALKERINFFKNDVDSASQTNRLLCIGIVGQIKRGKSTFLNSLLFNGEDVLPRAASPMTAALTRIQYGEELKAEIEFYTPEEWAQVEATAKSGFEKEKEREKLLSAKKNKGQGGFFASKNPAEGPSVIPDKPTLDEKACMELLEMAREGGQDIHSLLGQVKILDGIDQLSKLNSELADYVGSSGCFTPIVKSSTLTLNLPALRGIEVIDTPGINDPIVSRSRVTQKFMGNCDVIFFLSNCGQFLDQADMKLLAQNIPSRGIDDICLIGSLFDSVLLDDGYKYKSLPEAGGKIVQKLNRRAEDDFARICTQIEQSGEDAYMVKALKKALPPLFVSAMAFNIAKHWENLSESEANILHGLQEIFPDDDFNKDLMQSLANIEAVNDRIEGVRQRKDQILNDKLQLSLDRFEPAFREELRQLMDRLEGQREALASGDIVELTKRMEKSASKLDKGKSSISHLFGLHTDKVRKKMTKLNHQLKELAVSAKRVDKRTGTETKEESYTVDKGMGLCFWRSLTGNRYETKYRTISVNYSYASVHDAIDQVEQFVLEAEKELLENIEGSINIDGLRKDILDAAKKMVDFEDDSFDPDDILIPVERAVSRLTIPEVDLDCSRCLDSVTKAFNKPEVRDSEIAELQRSIADAVAGSLNILKTSVNDAHTKITRDLTQTGEAFTTSITSDMEEQIKNLKESQNNLQQSLAEYDQTLSLIGKMVNA